MAKRSNRRSNSETRTSRKSVAEEKIERMTWFFLVMVFAVLFIVPEENVPNWAVPTAGAAILLGSGVYQYSRRWRVGPMTWIAGTVMLLLAMINLYVDADQDFSGFALLAFAAVIGIGVLTGET
jgi:Na+/H+ antiporter NhaD/arsenite permease-like protein